MKAVLVETPGAPENMKIGDYAKPEPQEYEILVRVRATALNRADTLQRRGMYPPPPGASPILGLEIAGEVDAVGAKVTLWKKGDIVFGLVPGGGYAEFAVIHEEMAMAIPSGFSAAQVAAIPEVFLTAYQSLVWLAQIKSGEKLLIHAAASGVGTAAIQLARALGAGSILATASAGKHPICLELGADVVMDYKTQDFAEVIRQQTEEKGVDIIIDFIAAPYFHKNIDSLSTDGRLVLLALLGGMKVPELNLGLFLRKRLKLIGSTLRARALEYQIQLNQELKEFLLPRLENGSIMPVIDTVMPWTAVAEAHQMMENNQNTGKIILEIA